MSHDLNLTTDICTPHAKGSQIIETVIAITSTCEKFSLVRDRKASVDERTENEKEMQVWTQRLADRTEESQNCERKRMTEQNLIQEMNSSKKISSKI